MCEILSKVRQICSENNYGLRRCCVIGSSVYFDKSSLLPNDTDLLCVVSGEFDTDGSIDYTFSLRGQSFDLQIIHLDKYRELLAKNHMFYVESRLVPKKFVLFSDCQFELKIQEDLLLDNLAANIKKTMHRAKNNFASGDFRKGKKQVLHVVRIGMFAKNLLERGNIDFDCCNHLFELVDDSQMTLKQWIDLVNELYPHTIGDL
jgi:hypothetical protein